MTGISDQLEGTLRTRAAKVGVIGMGYVGLALAFVKSGFAVTGFDTDPTKVDALNQSRSYIHHISSDRIATAVKRACPARAQRPRQAREGFTHPAAGRRLQERHRRLPREPRLSHHRVPRATRSAELVFHDPYLPTLPRTRAWPHLENRPSEALTAENVARADAVLIVTAHKSIDYDCVAKHAQLIVDTRGVYRQPMRNLVKA